MSLDKAEKPVCNYNTKIQQMCGNWQFKKKKEVVLHTVFRAVWYKLSKDQKMYHCLIVDQSDKFKYTKLSFVATWWKKNT